MDYAYDPTVIQRMTEALDMLLINRSAQFLEQTRMDRWANYAPRDKRISLIQRGTDLADFIAPPPSAAQHKVSKVSDLFTGDMRLHSWALRHSTTPPMMVMDGDPPLGSLNPVQIKAVAMALQHRMTIIQGVCQLAVACCKS